MATPSDHRLGSPGEMWASHGAGGDPAQEGPAFMSVIQAVPRLWGTGSQTPAPMGDTELRKVGSQAAMR